MAEGFFNFIASEKNLPCTASSAGISTCDGLKASEYAITSARFFGVDISKHRSRMITSEIVNDSDLIYLLNPNHYTPFVNSFPEAEKKTFILGNGISDPYGGSLEIYTECAEQIYEAVKNLPILNEKI